MVKSEMAKLEMAEVHKHFIQGGRCNTVLNGVSISFEQRNTYAITGVSGVGKSTFMHILAGLDAPDRGNVLFNGRSISLLSVEERTLFFNSSVGLVFQLPYLIKELSVVENVMTKGLIEGIAYKQAQEQAQALLKQVGLERKARSMPSSLSGGQQQRVALARALFNKPAFLLADEPTGNLDEATGRDIVELLLSCREAWGMGIIVSSHDAYVAEHMEHIVQLKDGALLVK